MNSNVIFNLLKMSEDGNTLYVDVKVNGAEPFENIYLDGITVMTADKVSETDPRSPTSEYIYKETFDQSQQLKEYAWAFTAADFLKSWEEDVDLMKFSNEEMHKTLFFIYIKIRGVVSGTSPCGSDEEVTIGITFYDLLLHRRVMYYTRSLADDCNVPVGFADFILLWNAFKTAVDLGHYVKAIEFFNQLFFNPKMGGEVLTSKCGCHG